MNFRSGAVKEVLPYSDIPSSGHAGSSEEKRPNLRRARGHVPHQRRVVAWYEWPSMPCASSRVLALQATYSVRSLIDAE